MLVLFERPPPIYRCPDVRRGEAVLGASQVRERERARALELSRTAEVGNSGFDLYF
jgi:hypothetical protein